MDGSSAVLREGLSFTRVDDEGIVYDEAGGNVHVLNGAAAFVWELLERGATVEQIVTRFGNEHVVPAERARADVIALLADLDALGLLGDDHDNSAASS